jgi:hypothetical protein
MSGDVMVFCHYEPTTCGFFSKCNCSAKPDFGYSQCPSVNLTNIYETATLTSEYPLLMRSGNYRNFQFGDHYLLSSDQYDML